MGRSVEDFVKMVSLKKKIMQKSIYKTIVECLMNKGIQLNKLNAMGFDGAARFSGKHIGVQSRLKKHSP